LSISIVIPSISIVIPSISIVILSISIVIPKFWRADICFLGEYIVGDRDSFQSDAKVFLTLNMKFSVGNDKFDVSES
jgi:hypothetical protein